MPKQTKPAMLNAQQIQAIQDQVLALAESVVPRQYFMVGVEMAQTGHRWHLRVDVDERQPGKGIRLDDCETISRLLEPLIDEQVTLLANFPYNLEVSSPGLFRQLTTEREFAFYTGRTVEILPKGQPSMKAVLKGMDPQTREILFVPTAEALANPEPSRLPWNPKQIRIALSPTLQENLQENPD